MGDEVPPFSTVASTLWRLREALEGVLFKAVEEQLILEAGRHRWLAHANRELEGAVVDARGVEVLLGTHAAALAAHLDTRPDATLAQLAAIAPEPWKTIYHEHRDSLRNLLAEVDAAVADAEVAADKRYESDEVSPAGALDHDLVRRVSLETIASATHSMLRGFVG
jgi:hypothetical protein